MDSTDHDANFQKIDSNDQLMSELKDERSEITQFKEDSQQNHHIGKNNKVAFLPYFLFMGFAMGSWIDINSIFSQVAILSTILPEKDQLTSYITLVIQIANIFPILYGIGRKLKPSFFHERPFIFIILSWGMVALVLVAFFHDKIITLSSGVSTGLPLIVLTFSLAAVDTLSTVTFLPYMALFPPCYMSCFFLGQSLSGFIPSILSLIQQLKSTEVLCETLPTPNKLYCPVPECKNVTFIASGKFFSTSLFFLIIAAVMLFSLICFMMINYLSLFKRYALMSYVDHYKLAVSKGPERIEAKKFFVSIKEEFKNADKSFLINLLSITVVSFLGNGIIYQTMPFACFPYGVETFHIANNVFLASGALTSIIFLWKSFSSPKITLIYSIFGLFLSFIVIVIAALATNNILMPKNIGTVLIFLIVGHIYNAVRQVVCTEASKCGANKMFVCSVFIQIGSLLGTLSLFFPVSIGCVFNQK